ncbi:MAG TPA: hypothetical protein VFA60_08785 [Terriglobales bacterium]|nr:hypothetical protein [Terriglobales bacterium]
MPRTRRFGLLAGLLVLPVIAVAQGQMHVWADQNYDSWENGLHTEFTLNGELVDIFTATKAVPINLKPGWNTIVMKTTPQPSNKHNELIFRIGPMQDVQKGSRTEKVMQPVLWEFRNGTDWNFKDGEWSHPLGPDVKQVTLAYKLYYAGLDREMPKIKAGDYILVGKPNYNSWNSPVIATVWLNGAALNSITLQERNMVVTDLIKPGRNELRIVSTRIKDAIKNNDEEIEILGPASWNVTANKYEFPPVMKASAMQGWTRDPRSGQLSSRVSKDGMEIDRVVPFMIRAAASTTPSQ